MARTPVKQISYTLGCAHHDGYPIYILGSFYDSKRKQHPDAFVVKVTEERMLED